MKTKPKVVSVRSTEAFQRLIKAEAAKRGITIDELLNAAVKAYVKRAA